MDLIRDTIGPERGFVARILPDRSNFVEAAKRAVEGITYGCAPPVSPAVEVVYLQGLTNSARPYLDSLKAEVPNAFRELQSNYPTSKFALEGFANWPTYPRLSYYWIYNGLSPDVDDFDSCLRRTFIPSARDCRGMVMEALLFLANDANLFTTTEEDSSGRPVHRAVIVIIPEAPPTVEASVTQSSCPDYIRLLPPPPNEFTSFEQVGEALAGIGYGTTHVAFGVPDELVGVWSDVATVMTGMGVTTTVHPILDVEGMVRAAADPLNLLQ
eukprot:Polyplicarium_translucidae@DN3363_c1_g2_i4.p3